MKNTVMYIFGHTAQHYKVTCYLMSEKRRELCHIVSRYVQTDPSILQVMGIVYHLKLHYDLLFTFKVHEKELAFEFE